MSHPNKPVPSADAPPTTAAAAVDGGGEGELSEDALEQITGGTKAEALPVKDVTQNKQKTAEKAADAMDKLIRG